MSLRTEDQVRDYAKEAEDIKQNKLYDIKFDRERS